MTNDQHTFYDVTKLFSYRLFFNYCVLIQTEPQVKRNANAKHLAIKMSIDVERKYDTDIMQTNIKIFSDSGFNSRQFFIILHIYWLKDKYYEEEQGFMKKAWTLSLSFNFTAHRE